MGIYRTYYDVFLGHWSQEPYGAYSALIFQTKDKVQRPLARVLGHTTALGIFRLDLLALLEALEKIPDRGKKDYVKVWSRIDYTSIVLRTNQARVWRDAGWVTKRGKPIRDRDLLERVLEIWDSGRFGYKVRQVRRGTDLWPHTDYAARLAKRHWESIARTPEP